MTEKQRAEHIKWFNNRGYMVIIKDKISGDVIESMNLLIMPNHRLHVGYKGNTIVRTITTREWMREARERQKGWVKRKIKHELGTLNFYAKPKETIDFAQIQWTMDREQRAKMINQYSLWEIIRLKIEKLFKK